MDLVAGIRKEGSRGGRDSFKWSDVKESSHREHYLGHSLMAPVGRWQQGRDLNWYAKNKDGSSQQQERDEEIRRIKEAEQDAMARALGLPVAPRSSNANMTPLGGNEVRKAIQETTDADDGEEAGRGIGFGSYGGLAMDGAEGETLAAIGMDSQPRPREKDEGRSSRGHRARRDRSRDADRKRDRDRDQRDRGSTRHRKDRDAHPDRSEYHHRHRREYRSRSRSPRRDHRSRYPEEHRDRRHNPDARRQDGRHERRRSYSPHLGPSDRGAGKDGKHSDHHAPVDRHLQDSRRDRDLDRSHRDRRR